MFGPEYFGAPAILTPHPLVRSLCTMDLIAMQRSHNMTGSEKKKTASEIEREETIGEDNQFDDAKGGAVDTSKGNTDTTAHDNKRKASNMSASSNEFTPTKLDIMLVSSRDREPKKKRKGSHNGKPYSGLQAKWDEMFNRLLDFKKKHSHCLVPNRYSDDPALGAWVSTQRRQVRRIDVCGNLP